MPPVVTVVGSSNAGKTLVAASLVTALTQQGYRVAAVKHCPHGHDLDRPNSDTYRLQQAGAVAVVASSPGKVTRVDKVEGDVLLESIASKMGATVDIVVAEGFKSSSVPKVLVVRGNSRPPAVENVVAVVSNSAVASAQPTYGFDDLAPLAEQLRGQLLTTVPLEPPVMLAVDGVHIPLSRYASGALAGILRGFVSSLKGVPAAPREIRVSVQVAGEGMGR